MSEKKEQKTANEPTQFVFFGTYAKALERIADRSKRAELCLCIEEYGCLGREPQFDEDLMAAAFEGIRGNLDISVQNYKNGKKGGRPKGSGNASSKRPKKSEEEAETTRSPETTSPENQEGTPDPEGAESAVVWDETDLLEWHE